MEDKRDCPTCGAPVTIITPKLGEPIYLFQEPSVGRSTSDPYRCGDTQRYGIVLGENVLTYMRDYMAMPNPLTDQEQNWIAGHLATFAHHELVRERARVARARCRVSSGCDQCEGQGLDSGNAGAMCGQCGRILGTVE